MLTLRILHYFYVDSIVVQALFLSHFFQCFHEQKQTISIYNFLHARTIQIIMIGGMISTTVTSAES